MTTKSIRYAPLVAVLACLLLILTPHMTLAAVAYENHTTAARSTDGTTLVLNVPSGTVAGDLLLAAIAIDTNETVTAPGTGVWTLVNQGVNGTAVTLAVFYRVASGSEPTSYTFSWAGNEQAAGVMLRYSGVDTATPLDLAAVAGTGTTTAPTAPTITTVTNGARIVRFYGADDDDLNGTPYPAGHIGRVSLESTDTDADSCSLGVAEMTQATAGATGTAAFALLASEEWRAVTVALRPAAAPSGTIGGVVYRDLDADGIRDLREVGLSGITVTAYNAAGASVATATTDAKGAYRLTGLTDGAQVRLEITGLPSYLRPGPVGTDCRTTVFFTASPVDNYNVGAASPPDYCQSNPDLATTVFVEGNNTGLDNPTAVRYPYLTVGTAPTETISTAGDIGTVYGLAYQRSSGTLFGSAYAKRGAGLGPSNSTGTIYRMDADGTATSLFLDLNASGATYTGPNPHPNGTTSNWLNDPESFSVVGKVGLGDIDISEDELTLYAVNLYRKELVVIPLGDDPSAPVVPTAGQIGVYPVPIPASCNGNGVTAPSSDDLRPFALKANDGLVYVGMVCSAQSMVKARDPQTFAALDTYNIRSSLRAYVYTFNPATNTFSASPVLDFALNYPRRHVNDTMASELNNGEWLPWNDTWYPPYAPMKGTNIVVNPQPILSDIEFDGEGYMMLGFRDRWADQAYATDDPGPNGWSTLMSNRHGGEILLAYWNGSAWTLESSGKAGARSTGDPDKAGTTPNNGGTTLATGSGPGDATNGYYEFYHDEHWAPDWSEDFHRELALGSLAVLPGSGELVSTLYDASVIFDNGTLVLSNDSGGLKRTAQVFPGNYEFGKAGGVGDVELLCSTAPVEIGNRVWQDTDGDGIQDPDETPIADVTIRLYNAAGTLVATTATAGDGTWYFRTATGLAVDTQYFIVVDPAEFQAGGNLYGYSPTTLGAGTPLRDSDAAGVTPIGLGSQVGLVYTTGAAGQNDHTLDMGFRGKVSLGNQVWNDQDNDGQYDAPVRVGDLVWYDLDADGIQDAGEAGVAGVSVSLYDYTNNRLLDTTTTDAAGAYLFDNLPPGDYYVIFGLNTLPPGFSVTAVDQGGNDDADSDANQTTGQTGNTGPLSAGQQNLTLDMGLVPTGVVSVGDRVWYDLDRDGVQDAGEPGVPGVRVELHPGSASDCSGRPLATTTTGDDGYYLFAGLAPASYRACFDLASLPAGYQVTTQNAGSDDTLDSDADAGTGLTAATPSLTAGQSDRSLDMGIRAANATTNSIGDKVWVDRNRDGDQDGGAEPGVPGVRVELHPQGASCSDMPLMAAVTDEFGNYLFAGLPDGSYFVCFGLGTLPSGYEVIPADQGGDDGQDSDANTTTGATPPVSVSGGAANLTLDMGIRLASTSVVAVGDRVWLDADRDGIQDAGEPGVPGVNARLYQNGQSCVEGPTNNGGWTANVEWEHGTPSYGWTRCNSGTGCWVTDLDNTYAGNNDQNLYSPVINIPAGSTTPVRVTWAHALNLGADTGDRVRFYYRCNGGTWTAMYDTNTTGVATQPWITMRADTTCTAGQTLEFLARLQADGDATTGAGYFVDDVSVRAASGTLIYSQNFDPTPANAPLREEATDADGSYLFDGLPAGNYFVCFDRTTIPTGFEVTTQNAGSNDTVDSDASPTTGATASTGALAGGQSDLTLDMGIRSTNASPVSVGDKVWYDGDRDGVQDAGEPGVEGVRVTLYAANSTRPLASTTTGSNGQYLFAGLAPGSYYVIFDLTTLPAGYAVTAVDQGGDDALDSDANTATGQTPVTGAIGAGGSNLTLDMGIVLAGDVRVGDRVWYDDDRDGRQDAGESGVPGVTVYLHSAARSTTCADDPLGSTTTGADGRYLFANLAPGDYFVCFDLDTLPAGYQLTSANTQTDDNLDSDADAAGKTAPTGSLAAGRYDLSLDMGIYTTGDVSVGDYVWYDRDRDGIQDAGEGGVPGVTVELYRDGQTCKRDMPLATTTTGSDGRYLFDNLAAGSYFVCFDLTTLPAGYEVTAQNAGGDDALDSDADPTTGVTASTGSLSAGQSNLTLDMGIRQTAAGTVTVGDRVWYDDDRDGVQDAGERGVPGVDVTLRGAGTGTCSTALVLATDTTDASGLYLFDGLAAGDYFVCFDLADLPAGYVVTGRNQGSDDGADSDADDVTGQTANTGTLAAGEVDRSLDMGIYAPNHELPLPGVTVYLFLATTDCNGSGSGAVAVTTTDANGHYVFTNLPPGDYYVYVPASDFASGGVLEYMVTSTGNDPAPDPDNDTDNEDNGSAVTSGSCAGGVSSGVVTVGTAQEPTNDGRDDPNTPDVSHNLTIDLGFFEPLAVGNLVWYDLNGDGDHDSGEPTVQNVSVELYRDVDGDGTCEPGADDGAALATDTTDANGRYEFLSLSPGSYCIRVAAGQFGSGQALAFDYSTAPTEADPDSNVEDNDNGLDANNTPASDGVSSGVFTLAVRAEPIDDTAADQPTGYRDSSANTTVDLGFVGFDLGDLPDETCSDDYASTTFTGSPLSAGGDNGARHLIWPAGTSGRILLGATVDVETNGQESCNALGDDAAGGDDEDGVTQTGAWVRGAGGGSVDVVVTGGPGYLNAWIDWNGDGDLVDSGEQIFLNEPVLEGSNALSFDIPGNAPANVTLFARFRLDDQSGGSASPTGWASNGEVEDYQWDPVPTAVELVYFTATAGDSSILLAWETVSEVDNVGFSVYRAESPTGARIKLNDELIPSQAPGSPIGAIYEFPDATAEQGRYYYYWLENVDIYGQTALYGPKGAIIGSVRIYLPLVIQ